MKKSALLLSILFMLSLVAAADNSATTPLNATLSTQLQNADQKLEQPITLPLGYRIPLRFVFGSEVENPIPMQRFSVQIAVWVMLFLIIAGFLRIVLRKTLWMWAASLVLTGIFGAVGIIGTTSDLFFSWGAFLSATQKSGWLTLIFVLILIVIGAFIVLKAMKIIKSKAEIEKAVEQGYDIALERATAKAAREMTEKLSKKD